MIPRVAVVVPALQMGGGVPGVAAFLYRVMLESARFQPELISIATASDDEGSVRLLSPRSWLRGPRITSHSWRGLPYRSVGSAWGELEFQRYQPRRSLTALLEQYDLIQIVAGTPALAHIARGVAQPIVLQVATMVNLERRAFLARGGVGWLWRRAMTGIVAKMDISGLRHVDTVFVENERMLGIVRQHLPAHRVIFNPPGIDSERFRPAPHEDGYILTVGRLDDPRKNVSLLFEAYRALRDSVPDAPHLVLAGQRGPTPEDWRRATTLGIDRFTDVRLELTDDELAALYRGAMLFVLTSDEEGLGLSILEAMASGLPVVSTRSGGPETSVIDGETGFLVPLGDVRMLADRIRTLLRDAALRSRMGRAARERAVSHFSLATAGARFLSEYDELLRSHANRSRGTGHADRITGRRAT